MRFLQFAKNVGAAFTVAGRKFGKIVCSKTAAFLFGLLSSAAVFAQGEAPSADPAQVGNFISSTDGSVSFDPGALMQPIKDAVISSYQTWAILVIIIIVVGLMVWIFKKKG